MTDNAPDAAIAVTTKFFVLAFLLYFFRPKIHIDDGPPIDRPWGTTLVPVQPGQHTVRCYVPYLFYKTMGNNAVTVNVPPGQVTEVTWRAPWLVFLMGKMSSAGSRPLTAADTAGAPAGVTPQPVAQTATGDTTAPGWHPDPHGRHELRYWDGTAWTANVSDGGVTATDDV